MTTRRPVRRRPTRRSLFRNGFSAALASLAFPGLLAGSEDDKALVQPFDRIEPEKYPWGWIRWLMNGKIDPHAEMTMGIVSFEPNQINALHIHPNSAEFLHMISGSAEHLVDGRWVTLKAGDTLRIPRNVPHQARSGDKVFTALIVYDTPTRIMVPVAERPAGTTTTP